jgi:hypothetical protein
MKTKSIIFFFAIFTFLHFKTYSQDFYWLKGGWQYVRVSGHNSQIYTPRNTFHFGGGVEKLFSNPYGLKLEVNINQKGFNSFISEETQSYLRIRQNDVDQLSLAFPVLGTLHLRRMHFEMGISLDFLLQSDQHDRETTIYNTNGESVIKDHYNHVKFMNPELAAMWGIGIRLFKGMHLSARYIQGLSPISRTYNWTRMSYAQVSLSLRLGEDITPMKISELSSMRSNEHSENYRINSHRNISRIIFTRTGDGNQIRFRWQAAEGGSMTVSNINIETNSGIVTGTGSQVMATDVVFPVSCRVYYTMTNTLSGQSYESMLDFMIDRAGLWTVTLHNN